MLAGIKEKIRAIQDFPKEGILFRDITTALKEPETMKNMVDFLYEHYKDKKIEIKNEEEANKIAYLNIRNLLG